MSPEAPVAITVLLRFTDVLAELGLKYHLGGSYASSIHGIPRQTQDIDLVVDMRIDTVAPLAAKLAGEFYLDTYSIIEAVQQKSNANLLHLDSGIKIDIFMRGESAYDNEEFLRAAPVQMQRSPARYVHVKSAEDILLRKLQWYRHGGQVSERQWQDAMGIARIQAGKLDIGYLRRWAAELNVADLLEHIL